MLSYQHMYHAGNKADIHKHSILLEVLTYCKSQKSRINYIETHAGRGLYQLTSPTSQKTMEYLYGAEKYLENTKSTKLAIFIQNLRKKHKNLYPGSPYIAKDTLSNMDNIYLHELHPREFKSLKKNIIGNNINLYNIDGYSNSFEIVRNLANYIIFIDPSYEVKTEYVLMTEFIEKLLQINSQGIIILWYPILKANQHEKMVKSLLSKKYKDIFTQEIIYQDTNHHAMLGSGIVILNSPSTLEPKFKQIKEELCQIF